MEDIKNNLHLFLILRHKLVGDMSNGTGLSDYLKMKFNLKLTANSDVIMTRFCQKFCSEVYDKWIIADRKMDNFLRRNGHWLEQPLRFPKIPELQTMNVAPDIYEPCGISEQAMSTCETPIRVKTEQESAPLASSSQSSELVAEHNITVEQIENLKKLSDARLELLHLQVGIAKTEHKMAKEAYELKITHIRNNELRKQEMHEIMKKTFLFLFCLVTLIGIPVLGKCLAYFSPKS